jgi:UDP-N-acetylmuramoylalanine--D-glutamate ligase
MSALVREMGRTAKEVIMLPGTGTDRAKALVPNAHFVSSLEEALNQAVELSEDGDAILFSPAFASFGLFKNEYDRNDRFVEAVRALP